MKKEKLKYIILLLTITFILNAFSGCKDDQEETLPPETQTGANTFGCLVNGKVWRNQGMAPFPGPNLQTSVGPGYFQVHATRLEDWQGINIKIRSDLKVGSYALNNEFQVANYGIGKCGYETDSIVSGTLEITRLDTVHFIISGRFHFKAAKVSTSMGTCDSLVNVTEGRFDIKYID